MNRSRTPRGRPLQALSALAVTVAVAALGTACVADRDVDLAPDDAVHVEAGPRPTAFRGPSTTPPSEPTTPPPGASPPAAAPPVTAPDPCLDAPDVTNAPDGAAPENLTLAIEAALTDPRLSSGVTGASIWIEGWGEIVAHNADDPLLPASNQKLATAVGALTLLDHDSRLQTRVLATGPVVAGRLEGDLVVVGGGDPTLASAGPHSIEALASTVHSVGIHSVTGSIRVDETRYSTERAAPGWLDWQQPAYGGALSAVIVDRNQVSGDTEYLKHPALAAGDLLRRSLARHGTMVADETRYGTAPAGARELTALASPTVAELVKDMLLTSDNMAAETLFREIGIARGGIGSTAAAGEAIDDTLAGMCIRPTGTAADGSGLSRDDARSTSEWLRILHASRSEPWFPVLYDSLPIAGRTGTLGGRLSTPATAGNVRAKTGWTIPARGLSGYLTTTGGRQVVFSVIANGEDDGSPTGDRVPGAEHAIDELIEIVAAWPT